MNLKRGLELLEISPDATFDEARNAYRLMAQVWHPDKHAHNEKLQAKATDKIKEINAAWAEVEAYFKSGSASTARSAEVKRQADNRRENKVRYEQEKQQDNNPSDYTDIEQCKYIVCPLCNIKNIIQLETPTENAICGKCGQILFPDIRRNAEADDNYAVGNDKKMIKLGEN